VAVPCCCFRGNERAALRRHICKTGSRCEGKPNTSCCHAHRHGLIESLRHGTSTGQPGGLVVTWSRARSITKLEADGAAEMDAVMAAGSKHIMGERVAAYDTLKAAWERGERCWTSSWASTWQTPSTGRVERGAGNDMTTLSVADGPAGPIPRHLGAMTEVQLDELQAAQGGLWVAWQIGGSRLLAGLPTMVGSLACELREVSTHAWPGGLGTCTQPASRLRYTYAQPMPHGYGKRKHSPRCRNRQTCGAPRKPGLTALALTRCPASRLRHSQAQPTLP
jgi:hypothetical protein